MVCLLELQLAIKSEDVSSVWKVPALIEFSWTLSSAIICPPGSKLVLRTMLTVK